LGLPGSDGLSGHFEERALRAGLRQYLGRAIKVRLEPRPHGIRESYSGTLLTIQAAAFGLKPISTDSSSRSSTGSGSSVFEPSTASARGQPSSLLRDATQEALKRAGERDKLVIQRDAARAKRDIATTQVEALGAALAAAEQDRDRWHEMAMAPKEDAPVERRPWWRRLAG
jgi:outer membrane murein-binding lipoprotein Lpp